MKVLGLIPARGGSKGVPHKNRKLLNGKPLLAYTIEAALKAKQLNAVVFSSEDDTLISLAKEFGATVPFKRPEVLATDQASSLDVVKHAVETLSDMGQEFDAICLLQVTNPFRKSSFIDDAILKFKMSQTDSLVSVLKVPHQYNPHWVFEVRENGNLALTTGAKEIVKRRQDLPDAYIRDGAIYLVKTKVLLQENSLYGNSISYIESDPELHINIDTMADWKEAEVIAAKHSL